MAAIITRSAHPDLLWPGVHTIFGLSYDNYEPVWSKIFTKQMGRLATEQLVGGTTFGLAQIKTESAPVPFDTDGEQYVTEATHNVYALGFAVTKEEIEDLQYEIVAKRRAKNLANSLRITIENVHANIFLNGFSGQFVYGDNQPLFSASHPTQSGLQSNLPTINADLSEASIEDMSKRVVLATNARGLNIQLQPKNLIVSAADLFNSERILNSQLRSGSSNNDINAMKNMGMFPGGVIVNPYFGVEETAAWYMQTTLPEDTGLLSIWKREVELEKDNEFLTQNARAIATARFVASPADWRAVFGTPGV